MGGRDASGDAKKLWGLITVFGAPLLYAAVGETCSTLEFGTQDTLPLIPHCLSPWLAWEPLP